MDESVAHAIRCHQAGQLTDAEAIYRRILSKDPNNFDALHLLGLICGQRGDTEQSIDLISRAIRLKPDYPVSYYNLGNIFSNKGSLDEAVAAYRQAIQLDPNFSEAYSRLGNVLQEQGRQEEAVKSHRQAAQLRPESAVAQNDLANALVANGDVDDAVATFQRALSLDPRNAAIYYNFGNALMARGEFAAAANCYQRAIGIGPTNSDMFNNLGASLVALGRPEEAIQSYEQAVQIRPNDAAAHWHLATALLVTGNFERGWEEFERRIEYSAMRLNRGFSQPQWDGAPPIGKTVLLHAEGGFGDALHFVRMVPEVVSRGGKWILECQRELVSLFAQISGVARIIPRGEQLPHFDMHMPLQGLPRILKIRLENIPNTVPYLHPPGDRVEYWKSVIPNSDTFKVGLVWAGSKHGAHSSRTGSIDVFAPLAKVEGVTFFSLQKGEESHQTPPAGMEWMDFTPEIGDFADCAALMANLDLIVSVDTSAAHLAGAIARPVWVLIPFACDFRWLRDRTDSPWYPTMRLFRQTPSIGWNKVAQNIAEALRVEVSKWRDQR